MIAQATRAAIDRAGRRVSCRAAPPGHARPACGGRARARSRFPLLVLTCWGLTALLGACARSESTARRALSELEGTCFVPGGQVRFAPLYALVLYEAPEALLVMRYEVTRGEWRAFEQSAGGIALDPDHAHEVRGWDPRTDAWPASGMSQPEARAFAQQRGMRLPTSSEWLFAALGMERRLFPWGAYERQDSVANTLDIGLGRPVAVGTFEGGRTPLGLYDMLGNVGEWTLDDTFAPRRGPSEEDARVDDDQAAASAMGGSFRMWSRPIFVMQRWSDQREDAFLARSMPKLSRRDDVGLRCVAPAADYLWRVAPELPEDAAALARLQRLGERWGRGALPLLNELAARRGSPRSLAALRDGAAR